MFCYSNVSYGSEGEQNTFDLSKSLKFLLKTFFVAILPRFYFSYLFYLITRFSTPCNRCPTATR